MRPLTGRCRSPYCRARRIVCGEQLGPKHLELDRVRSGTRSNIDEFVRQHGLAIVVDARLCDEEARLSSSDNPLSDAQLRHV